MSMSIGKIHHGIGYCYWLLGGACVWCRAIVGGSEACHVAGVHLMWREHHCFWRVHYLRLLATTFVWSHEENSIGIIAQKWVPRR